MEQKTYRKRSGTTNWGMDYEVLGIANYLIDLVTDERIQDFQISSKHPDFGAFDDIVIETQGNSRAETYAIRLIHYDRGTVYLNQLQYPRGNFSIKKYFESAQSIGVSNAKFVLYTNVNFHFEKEKETKFCLKDEDFLIAVSKIYPNEFFKISGKTDYCYKFSVVEDASHVDSDKTLLYNKFFENFFLYTNQENVHDLHLSVTRKFKSFFFGSDVECNEYVRFLKEWSSRPGIIEKLDKKWMTLVVALKVFSSRIQPMSFNHSSEDVMENIENTEISRRNILRESIEAFDITIFRKKDSYDKVKNLWYDAACDLTDLKLINNLRTRYQLASTFIFDVANVDPLTLSVLLWLMGKCPLILKQDPSVNKVLELCAGEKIILLKDDRSEFLAKNLRTFETLADLKLKTSQFNRLIQNLKCSLQGKSEVPLESLFQGDEQILTLIKPDDLLEMLKGECRIGEEKETLPDPYVARCLLKNSIDIKILDNLTKDTAIILECVSETKELKNLIKKYNIISIGDDFNAKEEQSNTQVSSPSATVYLSKQRCDYNQFNAICNEAQNVKRFHHFRVRDDGNLEWIRSTGDLSDIKRFKLSKCYRVPESDMGSLDFKNNINLLNSDPGMGKSQLTKSFKINCFPECFTIILDPNDVHSFLKSTPKSSKYVDAFQNFLLNEKYESLSERDKAILSNFLKREKVVYVWDALDELSDEDRSIVTDLIVLLSKNCIQWVTSKCNLQNILENTFNVLALHVSKFEEEEQKQYIKQRLIGVSPVQDVEVIIKKIESTFALVEHKDILGIPLHIFLLTELLRKNPQKYSDLLNNTFTLTDLYRFFIEQKFNILYKKEFGASSKGKLAAKMFQIYTDKVLVEHTKAALRLLFPEAILTKLAVLDEENYESIHDKEADIGLVTGINDEIPRFVHNSFAEYLVARYFADNLQHKNIMQEFMFDERYINVRFFFDSFLAGDSQPHVAILYKNFQYLEICDSDILRSTDSGGRTVLHLACSWGQRYPELPVESQFIRYTYMVDDEKWFKTVRESKEYLRTLDFLLGRCDVLKSDQIYDMTPREYAQRSTCLMAEMRVLMQQSISKLILTDSIINMLYYSLYCGYFEEFKFSFQLLKRRTKFPRVVDNVKNKTEMTLLSVASLLEHEEIVKFLFTEGADIKLATKYGLNLFTAAACGDHTVVQFLIKVGANINLPDKYGRTPLYRASAEGHETVVELLVETGADINIPDKDGRTPLHAASQNGHETVVELLIQVGADINLPDEDGRTPLHAASQEGHETVVEFLVKTGALINIRDKDGRTPLHVASQNGHETVVKFLVNAGADINLPDEYGRTPLYVASKNGHLKIVEILIKAGADISLHDKYGQTPLHIASKNGHLKIVEILIQADADVNIRDEDGRTPLHAASEYGHETVVEFLFKAGARINIRDKDGRAPLHAASQNGHETVAEFLVKVGALISLPDKCGRTPLHAASQNGHERVAEFLVKVGALINIRDKDGRTPLHAASQNGHETVVKFLVKAGADISIPDTYDRTPLHMASLHGRETVVEILIKAGALINIRDKYNRTPLHVASLHGHETIVEILIKVGADVNLCASFDLTPLYIAFEKGHKTIVELLIKADADVNLLAINGVPPLHVASFQGHETIVKILIKEGTDINFTDEDGWTPLHVASQNGREAIVELLIKAGADVNRPMKDGQTPLHIASDNGHESIVEMLRKASVRNSVKSKLSDRTPRARRASF